MAARAKAKTGQRRPAKRSLGKPVSGRRSDSVARGVSIERPTAPSNPYPDGLYTVVERLPEKGNAEHYGILDVGNCTGFQSRTLETPVVYELTPNGVRVERFDPRRAWQRVEWIADQAGALERLRVALPDARYHLLTHNCEHFARFVATGEHQSKQVQALALGVGVAALLRAAGR